MRYAYTQLETSPVYEGTNRINWLRKPITADFYFYAGPRFTGTEAQSFILVGPGWEGKIPENFAAINIIEAPSNMGFMAVRFAYMSLEDKEIAIINEYQDKTS